MFFSRFSILCIVLAFTCADPLFFLNPGSLIFEEEKIYIYNHKAIVEIDYEGFCPTTKDIVKSQIDLTNAKKNLEAIKNNFTMAFNEQGTDKSYNELKKLAEVRILAMDTQIQRTIDRLEDLKAFAPTDSNPGSQKTRGAAILVLGALAVGVLTSSFGIAVKGLQTSFENKVYIDELDSQMSQVQKALDLHTDKINNMVEDFNNVTVILKYTYMFLSLDLQLSELKNNLLLLDDYIDVTYDRVLQYYNAIIGAGRGTISPILFPLAKLEYIINTFSKRNGWIPIYSGRHINKYYPLITLIKDENKLSVSIPFTVNSNYKAFTIFPFPFKTENDTIINEYNGAILVSPDYKYASMTLESNCIKSYDHKLFCDLATFLFIESGCPIDIILKNKYSAETCKGYWSSTTINSAFIVTHNHVHAILYESKEKVQLKCPNTNTVLEDTDFVVVPQRCNLTSRVTTLYGTVTRLASGRWGKVRPLPNLKTSVHPDFVLPLKKETELQNINWIATHDYYSYMGVGMAALSLTAVIAVVCYMRKRNKVTSTEVGDQARATTVQTQGKAVQTESGSCVTVKLLS